MFSEHPTGASVDAEAQRDGVQPFAPRCPLPPTLPFARACRAAARVQAAGHAQRRDRLDLAQETQRPSTAAGALAHYHPPLAAPVQAMRVDPRVRTHARCPRRRRGARDSPRPAPRVPNGRRCLRPTCHRHRRRGRASAAAARPAVVASRNSRQASGLVIRRFSNTRDAGNRAIAGAGADAGRSGRGWGPWVRASRRHAIRHRHRGGRCAQSAPPQATIHAQHRRRKAPRRLRWSPSSTRRYASRPVHARSSRWVPASAIGLHRRRSPRRWFASSSSAPAPGSARPR